MSVSDYLALTPRTLEQALADRLAKPGAPVPLPAQAFPLTLDDGTSLSFMGARCYFLSPNVWAKNLTVVLAGRPTPVTLHRETHRHGFRLEVRQ